MSKLNYGDVIEVKTTNAFWSAGEKMYIIVPEGDGELGLPEHAVCFKLDANGKPNKGLGAFEVPWTDMDFSTLQDAAELALAVKIRALDSEVKSKTASKIAAEKIMAGIKGNCEASLKCFAEEIE